MYDKGEAEASIMFNMIMDHVELYNRKMDSLSDTREILEGMMNADAFNEWDNQYVARKKLVLEDSIMLGCADICIIDCT